MWVINLSHVTDCERTGTRPSVTWLTPPPVMLATLSTGPVFCHQARPVSRSRPAPWCQLWCPVSVSSSSLSSSLSSSTSMASTTRRVQWADISRVCSNPILNLVTKHQNWSLWTLWNLARSFLKEPNHLLKLKPNQSVNLSIPIQRPTTTMSSLQKCRLL